MLEGPKLKDWPESFELKVNCSAKDKYPLRGSKTCWKGLVDSGDFIITDIFWDQAFTQSGTILSFAQSPPPMTLPALAEAILILFNEESEKKDL